MFEAITNFFKKLSKNEKPKESSSTAKERLHLVLMQDRANVSADFLELMRQEIIEVIKKYIDIDEEAIDVKLTNKTNDDGTVGAPALYANIPIITIKNEARKLEGEISRENKKEKQSEDNSLNSQKNEAENNSLKNATENNNPNSEKTETENNSLNSEKTETGNNGLNSEKIESNDCNKAIKNLETSNIEASQEDNEVKANEKIKDETKQKENKSSNKKNTKRVVNVNS